MMKKLSVSDIGQRGNWWRLQKLEYTLRAEVYVCLVECSSAAPTASAHASLSCSNGHHSQLGCWAKECEVWFILTLLLSS